MQGFVLLIGVLLWLFYALHSQPLLYKQQNVELAEDPAIAAQVTDVQQRFDAAHAERKRLMTELAALPDGPAGDDDRLRDYQRSVTTVAAIRAEARALVGGGKETNDIFCRYILDEMPPILLGLIIAAIFAAAMSSIDSVLNALSGATVIDIYRRWIHRDASDQRALVVGKFVTLLWGIVATFTALFFAGGGSIIEEINRVGSWFYGSLLGIFLMALFMKRAGGLAGSCGLIGGMLSVVAVHNLCKVQFLWYNVVGAVGVLVVGGIVSRFERRG